MNKRSHDTHVQFFVRKSLCPSMPSLSLKQQTRRLEWKVRTKSRFLPFPLQTVYHTATGKPFPSADPLIASGTAAPRPPPRPCPPTGSRQLAGLPNARPSVNGD